MFMIMLLCNVLGLILTVNAKSIRSFELSLLMLMSVSVTCTA